MNHDDIRQRLADVGHIDWSKVRREDAEEYFGDWLRIGPVMLQTTWRPGPHDADSVAQREAIAAFLQHAANDLRRLLADAERAKTTRESIMPTHSNPVYGPPPEPDRGEPARYLADAVEVRRPNGDVVVMDLVALADAAVNADRAVAGLREENAELLRKVATLEEKVERIQRAGRLLAGDLDSREEW